MAAPSGTVWGSVVGDYGRVGIHVKLTHTNTHTTRVITLWFWSKYGVSDSTNTLYYDAGTTNATSSKGAVSISTSVSSGSGWSTSNQVKLKEYSHTYARGTSDWSESCAMKLTGIDRVGGTMTATTKYTVPKLASYTVTYNANGGSGAPSSQTKYYGKNLTLSATVPTKSGYQFLGWGTSASATSVSYASSATYSANAGITLYAIWRKTITVYYGANGGSLGSIPASQSVNVYNSTTSASITLSSATGPSKSGYTFLGWNTNANATSVTYAKGTAYTFSSSVTLYAIWRKTITITYNANGGSYSGSTSVGYAYNNATSTSITITSTKPTKSGYTFLGWSTNANANSISYSSGTSYTFSANVTLYAIWKKTITITYDANGGDNAPTATNTDIYNNTTSANITLSATPPTRTDYTFLGWSLYSDATTASYSSGSVVTFTESKTLYAVWEVAYIKPTIYNVKVDRVDIEGNSADDGTFVAISMETKATEKLESVEFTYTINNTTYTEEPMILVQAITDTSLVHNITGWYTSVNKFILGTNLTTGNEGPFSVEHDYAITVTAFDEVGNNTYDTTVDSINVQIDIGQDSVAIGKIAEAYKYFEVDYKSKFNDAVGIGGTPIENKFTSYLPMELENNLIISYPNMLYGYNYSTGDLMECFCPQSTSGTTSLGYGGYVAKTGQTKVFGNNIEIMSNVNVKITSGDLQVFNAQNWLGRWCLTTDYIALYSAVVDSTTRKGWIGWAGTNDLYLTNETGGYVRLGNSTSRHTISAGHHYFANGTTYYISNGGGARLASVTGVGTDNWLGKHRFCGEWIGMYNTANGGTRKGYIGHDGSTHLYIVNENGGSIYYNTGGNHYFNKGVLISAGNLGSSKAYNVENFSIYCKWGDSANHDMVTRGSDGLGCALGWAGSASYATIVTIRGRTCKYQNASGTTTLSDRNLKKDFEGFSDAHDIFFDNLNPTTYKYILGSSGRSHFGYITQEVEEALESAGLTTKDFGGVNINKLSSRETETDDETGETKDVYNSATNYLLDKGIKEEHDLIYTEFIPLNTWQIQKLKKRVNEQDEIIKSQNERISNLESEISELKSLIQQLLNK